MVVKFLIRVQGLKRIARLRFRESAVKEALSVRRPARPAELDPLQDVVEFLARGHVEDVPGVTRDRVTYDAQWRVEVNDGVVVTRGGESAIL